MSAFGSNGMLLAQFPSSDIRTQLQLAIIDKTLRDLQDAKTAVLVVKAQAKVEPGPGPESDHTQRESGFAPEEKPTQETEIISYARWICPSEKEEGYVEPSWRFPKGTQWRVLDRWTELVEQAAERRLGGRASYREWFFPSSVDFFFKFYVSFGDDFWL